MDVSIKEEEKQELIPHNPELLGKEDPMYDFYMNQNWKVLFPQRLETERKSRIWYLCDEETKEVHRLVVENAFMKSFSIFLDGITLVVIATNKWSGRCYHTSINKDSPFPLEFEGQQFGLAQINFTLGGRNYVLYRHGSTQDIIKPTFNRRFRLFVDGLEITPSGWMRTEEPTSPQKFRKALFVLFFSLYVIVMLTFVFPPIVALPISWLTYGGVNAYKNRKLQPTHAILQARPQIERIVISEISPNNIQSPEINEEIVPSTTTL